MRCDMGVAELMAVVVLGMPSGPPIITIAPPVIAAPALAAGPATGADVACGAAAACSLTATVIKVAVTTGRKTIIHRIIFINRPRLATGWNHTAGAPAPPSRPAKIRLSVAVSSIKLEDKDCKKIHARSYRS